MSGKKELNFDQLGDVTGGATRYNKETDKIEVTQGGQVIREFDSENAEGALAFDAAINGPQSEHFQNKVKNVIKQDLM